jgi:hypothetical protein
MGRPVPRFETPPSPFARTRRSALLTSAAMTELTPVAGADPVKVGLGRSNISVTAALLVFLGLFVFFGTQGALTATDASSRVVSSIIAVAFAIPLIMLLRNLKVFLSPRYVIVDGNGVAIQSGKQTVMVPWPEVRAVGIAYEIADPEPTTIPHSVDGLKDQVKDYLADRAMEALQVSGQRRLVLEIYPAGPNLASGVPKLKPYWKALPPPVAGLPDMALRYPLPPVVSIAQQIAAGLGQRAPQRWLGWYPRPWNGAKK